jgi:hypothetical protein
MLGEHTPCNADLRALPNNAERNTRDKCTLSNDNLAIHTGYEDGRCAEVEGNGHLSRGQGARQ